MSVDRNWDNWELSGKGRMVRFYHLYARHTKHRWLRLTWLWAVAGALVWIWYHPSVSLAVTLIVLFAAAASLLAGWTGKKQTKERYTTHASH